MDYINLDSSEFVELLYKKVIFNSSLENDNDREDCNLECAELVLGWVRANELNLLKIESMLVQIDETKLNTTNIFNILMSTYRTRNSLKNRKFFFEKSRIFILKTCTKEKIDEIISHIDRLL